MYKVVIVDDEPKIRRKLIHSLDWSAMEIEVAGEAEDGEHALEIASSIKPDLMLVDICLPFISGLDLIDRLRSLLPDCIYLVITGHDEFAYAQQALRLGVFDYLLKPVKQEQLHRVVSKARERIGERALSSGYMKWADNQLRKNVPMLKERFMNEWMDGQIDESEVNEQLAFLAIHIPTHYGMMIVKVEEKGILKKGAKEWDRKLLGFAIQNVSEEVMQAWGPAIFFRDKQNHLIIIATLWDREEQWAEAGAELQFAAERYLARTIAVRQTTAWQSISSVPDIYRQLLDELTREDSVPPVVLQAKKYIDAHYHNEHLSLQQVAEQFQISPAYLSRLLRQESGLSFIDYLTQVRINNAIRYMNDPLSKMYEVSERVGYASQHYFSVAFKKVLGVSPTEYKKGGMR